MILLPAFFLSSGTAARFLSSVVLTLLAPLPAWATPLATPALPPNSQATQLVSEAAGITAHKLANGFRIILVHYPNASDVRINLLVKVGSKMEDYGQSGIAHLLEHMLFLKAGQRENVGADLAALVSASNATTDSDSTRYYASLLPEPQRVAQVLRIKADQFLRPVFDEQQLQREIQVVLNELDDSADNAVKLMAAALERNSFVHHGYSRTVGGARSDVSNTTVRDLEAFHRRHYRADNATLIVSGRFDSQQVLSQAAELFASAQNPPGTAPRNHTQEQTLAVTQVSKLALQTGVTRVASAWKLPGYANRQAHVADVAMQAVCDPTWGSLKRELIDRKKLAFSASCFVIKLADYSILMGFASAPRSMDPHKLSAALSQHLEDAAIKGVRSQDLVRAKVKLRNAFEQQTQTHTDMSEMLASAETAGDWRLAFWARDVEQAVTSSEANEVLRLWLIPINRADVLVRHTDKKPEISLPHATNIAALVNERTWPAVVVHGDRPPRSVRELAEATVRLEIDQHGARAAFISRRTQNDKVWLEFRNDHGSLQSLKGRATACAITDVLMQYGGAGLTQDGLQAKLSELNVTHNIGLSGFGMEVPRQHLQEAFEILLAVWNKPTLPRAAFDAVKAQLIGSLQSDLEDPNALLQSKIAMRFDNFPAGHPDKPETLQTKLKNTQRVAYAEAQKCALDFAKLSRVRLAVVGNIAEQDVWRLGESTQKATRAKIAYQPVQTPPAPDVIDVTPIVHVHTATSSASVLASAVIKISQRSRDYSALELAVFALNQKDYGRLWKRMRDELGLSYDTGVHLIADSLQERATVEFYATVSPDRINEAEQALQVLVDDLLSNGLTQEEISQAQKAWTTTRAANLDAESDYAKRLVDGLLTGLDFEWLVKFDESTEKLDARDIKKAIENSIQLQKLVWSIIKVSQPDIQDPASRHHRRQRVIDMHQK